MLNPIRRTFNFLYNDLLSEFKENRIGDQFDPKLLDHHHHAAALQIPSIIFRPRGTVAVHRPCEGSAETKSLLQPRSRRNDMQNVGSKNFPRFHQWFKRGCKITDSVVLSHYFWILLAKITCIQIFRNVIYSKTEHPQY